MKRITCLVLCVGLLGAAEKAMGMPPKQDPTGQEDVRPVPPILVIPMPVPVIVLPVKEKPEEGKESKQLSAREKKFAKQAENKQRKAALLQKKREKVFRA